MIPNRYHYKYFFDKTEIYVIYLAENIEKFAIGRGKLKNSLFVAEKGFAVFAKKSICINVSFMSPRCRYLYIFLRFLY